MQRVFHNICHSDVSRELIGETIKMVDIKNSSIVTESGKKVEFTSWEDAEYRADILVEIHHNFRGKKIYEVASSYYRSSFDNDRNGNIKMVLKILSKESILISINITEHISANDFRIPNSGVTMTVTD